MKNYKKWNKWFLLGMLAMVLVLSFVFVGCDNGSTTGGTGTGTEDDPWQITTAQQFNEIRNHLDGHYILKADIDLSSYVPFESIGLFEPKSAAPEDGESPKLELAFTGSFDGQNHKISNAVIQGINGVGLFGCVAENGVVKNLVVENVTVSGTMLVAGVIGYGAGVNPVENIKLQGTNSITGGGMAGTGMVGGIVGGGFCAIKDCEAEASVYLTGDDTGSIGIIAGGMEDSSIISCSAKGSVTVNGARIFGIGGLAACAMSAPEITDCTADVIINITGDNCDLIGGLVGYAGTVEGSPAVINGCTVNAVITAPSDAKRIGGIVGGGFYMAPYAAYFPEPSAFTVSNSSTSGSITSGTFKGTIAGYIYNNSTVEGTCTSTMTINGSTGNLVGATANSSGATDTNVGLDAL